MQFAACLIGGSFDESSMFDNMESCEWLANALWSLEVPNLDPCFAKMRAVCRPSGLLLNFCSHKLKNNYPVS